MPHMQSWCLLLSRQYMFVDLMWVRVLKLPALQVAGAGESLFEALEKGPSTGSGMSSLAGLAALAQTVGCNLIYPVLIRKAPSCAWHSCCMRLYGWLA